MTRHQGGRGEVVGDDVFAVLEEEIARDDGDPDVHWVGYFGYACRPDLPGRPRPGPAVPDAVWMRVRDVRVLRARAWSAHVDRAGARRAPSTTSRREYAEAFARGAGAAARRQLLRGQPDLPRARRSAADPVAAYLRLRAINPAPYAGLPAAPRGRTCCSSSPERYATIDRHRWLETKPIKGTTPRGATAEEDERAAHGARQRPEVPRREPDDRRPAAQRPVDGVRGRDGEVPSLMEVESYPSVHQLVSTVRGRLRDDVSTIGALRRCSRPAR